MIEFKGEQKRKIEIIRAKEEEEAAKKTAKNFDLPYENLAFKPIQPGALKIIPEKKAKEAKLAVIRKEGQMIHVIIDDPENSKAQEIIENLKKKFSNVLLFVVSRHSLEKAWSGYKKKGKKKKISGMVAVSPEIFNRFREEISTISGLQKTIEEISSQKDISIIVELLLASALALDASDIHVEPQEEGIRLRMRIDGLLHDVAEFDAHIYKLLLSRIKLFQGYGAKQRTIIHLKIFS